MRAHARRAGRILMTLAFGAAGGLLFNALGIPLAWVLGSLAVTAGAVACGVPVGIPRWLRNAAAMVIGFAVGASFATVSAADVLRWWVPLVAFIPIFLFSFTVGRHVVGRYAPTDPGSAILACFPGGLSELSLVADRVGGDVRTIALVHTVRIMTVAVTASLIVVFGGVGGGAVAGVAAPDAPVAAIGEMALFALIALAGFGLAQALRLPAAAFLGAMIVSAALHGAGVVEASWPREVFAAAQVVVGAFIGARFKGLLAAGMVRTFAVAFVWAIVLTLASLGVAGVAASLAGERWLDMFLAVAPGGNAEMNVIAITTGADVAMVGTCHALRIVFAALLAPFLFSVHKKKGVAEGAVEG